MLKVPAKITGTMTREDHLRLEKMRDSLFYETFILENYVKRMKKDDPDAKKVLVEPLE